MLKRKMAGGIGLASLSLSLLMAVAPATVAPAAELTSSAASAPSAAGHGLRLRWELERNEFTPQAPGGITHARFILTNLDKYPLPSQGWSLYFNCMDGVATGPLAGNLSMEKVAGGLFRIRPVPGFAGVAPGETLNVPYIHPNLVIKLAKAPAGPYLVYDSAPDVGQNIADYELLPVDRPEQLEKGGSRAKAIVTPQDTYRRNASANLLPAEALPPLFPTPLRLQQGLGKLSVTSRPRLVAPAALKTEAAFARSLFPAALPATGAGAPALRLSVGEVAGQTSPEAYSLTIKADSGIAIVGNSAAGVAYGLQSLRDLMPCLLYTSPSPRD